MKLRTFTVLLPIIIFFTATSPVLGMKQSDEQTKSIGLGPKVYRITTGSLQAGAGATLATFFGKLSLANIAQFHRYGSPALTRAALCFAIALPFFSSSLKGFQRVQTTLSCPTMNPIAVKTLHQDIEEL